MFESNLKRIKTVLETPATEKGAAPIRESVEVEVLGSYISDMDSVLLVRKPGEKKLHHVMPQSISEVLEVKEDHVGGLRTMASGLFEASGLLEKLNTMPGDLEEEPISQTKEQPIAKAPTPLDSNNMDWDLAHQKLLSTMRQTEQPSEELKLIHKGYTQGNRSLDIYKKIMAL